MKCVGMCSDGTLWDSQFLVALREAGAFEWTRRCLGDRQNADVNARTLNEDDTPLHLAVQYGRPNKVEDIVVKLMEQNADTQIRNKVSLHICSI